MKKLLTVLYALLFIAGCSAAPSPSASAEDKPARSGGNFTDQMKLAYRDDLDPEAGADLGRDFAFTDQMAQGVCIFQVELEQLSGKEHAASSQ